MPDPIIEVPGAADPAGLLVVRHGESEWNASGRWQGTADPPLSERGRHQAASAADLLANCVAAFDEVCSSPLLRASATATAIAERMALAGPRLLEEFVERDVGEWTGLGADAIERRWPGALGPPRRLEPPGGEEVAAMDARVGAGLDRLAVGGAGRRRILVAHGGVIRAIERLLGVAKGPIPNLVGWWLRLDPHGWTAVGRRSLTRPDPANRSRPVAP